MLSYSVGAISGAQDDMSPEQDIWTFLLDLSRVPLEAADDLVTSDMTAVKQSPGQSL